MSRRQPASSAKRPASNAGARSTARAKPVAERAANTTRADVLDAAAQLIVEEGYDACTMRKVAERVRIQAGSLYYHFSSKDEIIEEIMNSGIALLLDEVQGKLARLAPEASFEDRLRTAIDAHIGCMLSGNSALMQVYEYVPPVLKRRSRAMRDKYLAVWVAIFQHGRDTRTIDGQVDLAILVPYLLGGINRIPEWFRRTRFTLPDIVTMVSATLLHGVLQPAVVKPQRRVGGIAGRT